MLVERKERENDAEQTGTLPKSLVVQVNTNKEVCSMAAYMIVDNEVTDAEGFREYQ